MCVLITITLTSSYCDEIFHNDTYSHFFLFHDYLDRINWISLIDYDIHKIIMMSFIVLCRIVTITKLLFFVKVSCPYHWLCNDLHIYKICCIEPQHGDTCRCPCTQLYICSMNKTAFQLYITLKLHANSQQKSAIATFLVLSMSVIWSCDGRVEWLEKGCFKAGNWW